MKLYLLFLSLVLILFNCTAQNIPLYIGTYTKGDSEGIYRFEFNTKTGDLSNKQLVATIEQPSFISYNLDRTHIYAVSEVNDGYISAYKVEDTGKLTFLNKVSVNGDIPCHISFNYKGEMAVSNYGSGNVSLYTMSNNGALNEAFQIFDHNTENKKARAHAAHFFNDELYIADFGRNAVYYYKLKDDVYKLESPAIVKTTGNPGPRHFTLTNNGQYIYIINEQSSSITSVKRTDTGFEQIDYDTTLDEKFKGKSYCADIHLSKDERFLYGSNRGENSIAVFERNTKTGTINKIQSISTHGNYPRNFTLDPSGEFLLVANQISNNISIFKVNKTTGTIEFLKDYKAPTPVCLLF
ncbi:lactonase family protein [Thalassobellus sediminis]|uniref:lactonase family protein n=1 Tax=Thalassobellus sediminis TaxID=3367753 RepID=UPI0037BBCE99